MSDPKNTKSGSAAPKATFVSFLLDETGSMEPIKDDTIGGFNAYVEKLQQSSGDILFSLVSFNSSRTQKRYVAEPIGRVRPLAAGDYQPAAMTPLIDAAVKIIKATAEAVAVRRTIRRGIVYRPMGRRTSRSSTPPPISRCW